MNLKHPAFISTMGHQSLLLSLGFLLVLIILIKRAFKPSLNLPPAPKTLPIIGNLHQLLTSLPHHAFHRLAQMHGPVMLVWLGQAPAVVISSKEATSEIMKSQDLNFCSRPGFYNFKVLTYGCLDIGMAPYGDYWRQLRKICTIELLSAKRVTSYNPLFEDEISKLVTVINTSSSEKKPTNLSVLLPEVANSIIARCAFGGDSENQKKFMPAVKEMFKLMSGFTVVDLFPNIKYLDILSGTRSKVQRVHRQLDEILGCIVKDHELKRAKAGADEVEDLVDVLLRIKENGELEIPLTNDNIKAVILDMFAAGTETNSTVLVWAMSELMKHPQMMEKAKAEVRRVLKGKTNIEDTDLAELHYLKLIIKETLRMHPPGPLLIPRESIEACQLDGYTIPARTRVIINAWALGRDPQYWEDADTFKPERFSGNPIDFKGTNSAFVPFGGGRRICPGITFGVSTVGFTLARLLLHFEWELPNGMTPQELDMTESFGISAARKIDLRLLATTYPSKTS